MQYQLSKSPFINDPYDIEKITNLLSISHCYQYQYWYQLMNKGLININYLKILLSISISISILLFLIINYSSISMHLCYGLRFCRSLHNVCLHWMLCWAFVNGGSDWQLWIPTGLHLFLCISIHYNCAGLYVFHQRHCFAQMLSHRKVISNLTEWIIMQKLRD